MKENKQNRTVGISGLKMDNSSISNSTFTGGNSDANVGIFDTEMSNTHLSGLNMSDELDQTEPKNTPIQKTIDITKNSRLKKIVINSSKYILDNVVKIIIGIVIVYFCIKLGLKK